MFLFPSQDFPPHIALTYKYKWTFYIQNVHSEMVEKFQWWQTFLAAL